ncbi:hypothetical protein HO173_010442 [Letharia columbiana]|uniref:Uncharacterized protein n=1 Tax=Letharia columbiana TaxID=112416 RepID=A0A8H6L0S4_9LECA|nr:uncharacterized protein HO173_010442 [Letharia columbiana]KAF6231299.1 hypothetical protein HO173_010442 [Letharia columbiana]
MATTAYRWIRIRIIHIPKHTPLPTTKVMKEVNQRDMFAQMECLKAALLCSRRSNLSRRNRPALPPEEDSSSHTSRPG